MSDQATQLRRLVEAGRMDHSAAAVSVAPTSVPTGSISFRPRAAQPRPSAPPPEESKPVRLARAIAVTSGKGGVGKSNVALNLAVRFSQMGRKVCLLDADLGMANIDIMCNLTPRKTLQHVVAGRARLTETMLLAPGGFRLIPGASGVMGMADLGSRQRRQVLEQLTALDRLADLLIIDCAAGITENVVAFAAAANSVVVTTTNEPTAVTDAYGMIKSLNRLREGIPIDLVVNMVASEEEGRQVFERMNKVTQTFLKRESRYGGGIPFDYAVPAAVHHRLPFSLYEPDGGATRAMGRIAEHLLGLRDAAAADDERAGFFRRLSTWLGGGRRTG